MSESPKNAAHPDLEELLAEGLAALKENPELLKELTAVVNSYIDRMKALPDLAAFETDADLPEREKFQQILILSSLHYLIGLFRKTQSELTETNVSYEEVLGLLTHEFRNLLSTLDGYLRIVELDLSSLGQKELLETHRDGMRVVCKLFNIVDSILKFYQSDRKLLVPDYKMTAFEEDLLIPLELEYKPDLKIRNMRIRHTTKGSRRMIDLDSQLIEIAMRNLLENALKYSQPGSTIEINQKFTDHTFQIRIKSYNEAIPDDLCQGIFEKFRTKKIGNAKTGTGIGLFNVRNIVLLHGGTISCTSRRAKWITFTISLPLQKNQK